MEYDATIAIPTYNGQEFLDQLLQAIYAQKTAKTFEVLIIDSGSTDETLDIVKKYPKVRLHQIPNQEFGHGRTRNLAADMAKSEYILYLTQDAVPAHEHWLEAMIEPFGLGDKVGCVVGKQIPLPDCPVTIKREVFSVFRGLGADDGITLHRKNGSTEKFGVVNTFLSNANSAVRKATLKKIPFRDVDYAEDQGLAIDMLEAGYYKAYAPLGAVNHSHQYGVREYFRRKFDEYVGLRKTTGYKATAGFRELLLGSAKATIRDWSFLLRDKQYNLIQKIRNFIKAPFYNFSLRLAIRAASNQKISTKMHHHLSLEARNRKTSK